MYKKTIRRTSKCYRNPEGKESIGCGPYYSLPCSRCPASVPGYQVGGVKLFVAIAEKPNALRYMGVGFTEQEAKKNCIDAAIQNDQYTEKDLIEKGYEISVTVFADNQLSHVM
jgi:hypothetical protein